MTTRKPRHQAQQYAIRAEEAAIRPGDEHARQQETGSQVKVGSVAVEPEKSDEGIVSANNEPGLGGSEQNGRSDVDIGYHAQGDGQFSWQLDRLEHDKVLDRSQGTDGGTEDSPEKEREQEWQGKENDHRDRGGVIRAKKRKGHVLDRPDGAYATLLEKTEVAQAEQHEPKQTAPGSSLDRQPSCQAQGQNQHSDVDPLLGFRGREWSLSLHGRGVLYD